MTDIARLGLAVDSTQVTGASAALDKFQTAANAAAAGADKINAATGHASKTIQGMQNVAAPAVNALNQVAKAHGGVSTQAMAAQHSIRSLVEGLASGMPPSMVLTQQMNHLSYAASGPGGLSGAFREAIGMFSGIITPMRLVGGTAAIAVVGFAALTNAAIKSVLALDDLKRATDLTLPQLHALQQGTAFKGISDADFSKGIAGFADSVYQAQRNFGSLNGLMIANGQSAKDLQGYLGNVADLVSRSTSDLQKQKILREAGLPSDAAWVRYMEQGSAGIRAAADGTVKFSESAEQNLIRKAREFDDSWNTATTKMVQYFKSAAVDIASALGNIHVPDWMKSFADKALTINPLTAPAYILGRGAYSAAGALGLTGGGGANFADRYGTFERPFNSNQLQSGLNRRAGVTEPKTTQELQVANQQAAQRISLLGNLAGVEDQVRLKELELAAAALNGVGVSRQQAAAILNVVRAQAEMSRVQEMASLGIYHSADAMKAMQDQLRALIDRKLLDPNNAQEMASAMNMLAKQFEEVADAAKVAGSAFPQFQAALNEVNNGRKQLDSLLTEGMSINRSFFQEFSQNLRQGKGAWDSFKTAGLDALGRISDKLIGMAADKLFAMAFGGANGGGFLSSIFSGGSSLFAAAGGGTFGPGWGVVGERGPELIKVNQGSVTVVPNHISKPYLPGFAAGGSLDSGGNVRRMPWGMGGAGGGLSFGDTVLNLYGNADDYGIAQIRAELAAHRKSIAAMVKGNASQARYSATGVR